MLIIKYSIYLKIKDKSLQSKILPFAVNVMYNLTIITSTYKTDVKIPHNYPLTTESAKIGTEI